MEAGLDGRGASRRKLTHALWVAGILAVLSSPSTARPSSDSPVPEYSISLRFHLLRTTESRFIDTSADEPLVREWVERANQVWRPAGIRFEIDRIIEATPRNVAGFDDSFQAIRESTRERRAARREGRKAPKRGGEFRWRDMLPRDET